MSVQYIKILAKSSAKAFLKNHFKSLTCIVLNDKIHYEIVKALSGYCRLNA